MTHTGTLLEARDALKAAYPCCVVEYKGEKIVSKEAMDVAAALGKLDALIEAVPDEPVGHHDGVEDRKEWSCICSKLLQDATTQYDNREG